MYYVKFTDWLRYEKTDFLIKLPFAPEKSFPHIISSVIETFKHFVMQLNYAGGQKFSAKFELFLRNIPASTVVIFNEENTNLKNDDFNKTIQVICCFAPL